MKTNNQPVDALIAPPEHLDGKESFRPSSNASRIPIGVTLQVARRQFEREYVTAVLEKHHWRIPEAARMLGIQRPNLYRTIRRLHISRCSMPGTGGISSPFVLVDPGMTNTGPGDASVDDDRRSYRRRRAALRSNSRFTNDTE